MNQYLILLHDKAAFGQDLSPADMQRIVGEYFAWSERLRAAGRLVGGEKLKDGEGKTVRERGGKTAITDGPFSEGKEVVGGYFLIRAESYEEALELCRGNPHTKYGGTLELRCIEDLGGD
jgi:hypothetical protein